MRRALAPAALALALAACGKLQGFGGPVTPLVTFNVSFTGDLAPLQPAGDTPVRSLQVALVWGAQWLTEPFCVLPPESDAAAKVIAAGCRDTFGFVPARVDQSAPIVGQTASLSLAQLPTPDVMIGDVTARVAYASLVVYDDRNGDGTLALSQPHRTPAGGDRGDRFNMDVPDAVDVIYGASFLTMTAPDQRVAYREGGFNVDGAFYPRAGCGAPLPAFSILSAGGFSATSALMATLSGTLPQEDPLTCAQTSAGAVVNIAARMPSDVDEVGCDERTDDGSSRYRQPPTEEPDWTGRTMACAHIPSFDLGSLSLDGGTGAGSDGGTGAGSDGGTGAGSDGGTSPDAGARGDSGAGADGGGFFGESSVVQLVISGRTVAECKGIPGCVPDRCQGLTHYALRGCRESVSCALPDWDFTANPPSWWPCPH